MSGLVLRDVHVPPAPPWWPPAPGWWIALALVVAAVLAWRFHGARGRRRRRRATAWFDAQVARSVAPVERLALASELLRRAARTRHPEADRLDGEAWLGFLDRGDGAFLSGAGRLLLDGPFRPDVDPVEAEAALAVARDRFADFRLRG